MKKSDLVIIVLRVGALWLVVQSAQVAAMLFGTVAGRLGQVGLGSLLGSMNTFVVGFLANGLAAAALWLLAPAIARVMVPEPETPLGPLPEARDGWLVLAVQVLGLSTLIGQVRGLTNALVMLMQTAAAFEKDIRPSNPFPAIVATVLIGLWLVLGAEGIVGVIRRFRQAAHEPRC